MARAQAIMKESLGSRGETGIEYALYAAVLARAGNEAQAKSTLKKAVKINAAIAPTVDHLRDLLGL